MNFSEALQLLKDGKCVTRLGWNGKGMWLYLVDGSTFEVSRAPLNQHFPNGTKVDYRPHIDMRTADGGLCVWTAAQSDILAKDWTEVKARGFEDPNTSSL
jgi:hypothetical protein